MMNLLSYYETAVLRGEIIDSVLQREVLISMQKLFGFKSRWFRPKTLKGIYLYGNVGAGKTFLIDLLFQHLPEKRKARFHFHHFMQQLDLNLRKIQGKRNPLFQIAQKLAKTTRILCFDEFLVKDVAHAMMLGQLLQALTHHGVILVISTNTAPDDLYLDGIQRNRFLPAIALIKKNCQIIQLNEQRDYRCGREPDLAAYLFPSNEQNLEIMHRQFKQVANNINENGSISVLNRAISYIKRGDKAIWFDFKQICNLPRCQADYLEMAKRFESVFLSGLTTMEPHSIEAILFVYFIDVLYDIGIQLIILADVAVEELYTQGPLLETFKRTLSRLIEMQAQDFLLRHPRRTSEPF